jgi:hypothetical protein
MVFDRSSLMRLDRRTLLGRALSLLGGLCAGLLGGHKKAKADAPPQREFITLDTGIRMSEAEAARFAVEYTRAMVGGKANTRPAIFSLSDGDLTPGWIAGDEARWHGAGA